MRATARELAELTVRLQTTGEPLLRVLAVLTPPVGPESAEPESGAGAGEGQ